MIKKGDKVKQISGNQPGTLIGGVYEVVAGDGDSWLSMEGNPEAETCSDGEFFIKDEDGDVRYQVYPSDKFTGWEIVV